MFFGASSFNQPLDAWDVSSGKDMSAMLTPEEQGPGLAASPCPHEQHDDAPADTGAGS